MERLTERKRNFNGTAISKKSMIDREGYPVVSDYASKVLTKLADYEDTEEQGLLIRLPCKVGDTVYVVTSPFNVFDDIEYDENMKDEVYEAYVSSVSFYESGEQYRIYSKVTNHFIGAYFRECDFGKTVFFTKEEAEAKLAEMEESMTESEALESALKKVIAQEKSNWGYIENFDVDENWAVRTAIEQVQQYRQIGTLKECLRNKDFLDFLSDKMNPNDFEIYLRLYNALKEKGCE